MMVRFLFVVRTGAVITRRRIKYVTEANRVLVGSSCLLSVATVSKVSNLCGTHGFDNKLRPMC